MPRLPLKAITAWITEEALQHPTALADRLALRLGIGRRSANRLLKRLIDARWLVNQGTPRKPRHVPGLLREVVRRYPLAGLDEHRPWSRDFAPCFVLPAGVARLAQHAFTELLNNAIDHSGGSSVTVSMRQTAGHVQLLVSDDGCGLFDRIDRHFGIDDPVLALLDLSKGKLTSQPDRHSGRGLFFTSRIADVLDLHANAHAFQRRSAEASRWHAVRSLPARGTSVFVGIALDTNRDLDAVLREHSLDGAGYGFERTTVSLRLLTDEHTGLDSRAQARHAAVRLAQFRRAEIDFSGIERVGHGFADELFRVFAAANPAVELVPLHMAPQVHALVDSVRAGSA